MSNHDDIVKEWILLLFQWAKGWYEKSQLDAWVQFLLEKLRSSEVAQIVFGTAFDPHNLLFWILVGAVVYLLLLWLLLRKPTARQL